MARGSGKGGMGVKGTPGTGPASNVSDLANPAPNAFDLANPAPSGPESERACSELSDFQPWVPPSHPSWKPPDTRVHGHRLPNAELEEGQPDETVGEHLTAWALKHVSKNVSAAVRTLAQNYFKIKRIMGVRTHPGADGAVFFSTLNLRRGANCDAAFHHLYGNLRSGTDACGPCQRGLGPFDCCVQINGACANCRYNSAAKRCTLYAKDGDAKPKGTKRSRKATAGRGRKRRALDDDDDILDVIRKVPPKHLRRLADVFYQVADDLEEETNDSDSDSDSD